MEASEVIHCGGDSGTRFLLSGEAAGAAATGAELRRHHRRQVQVGGRVFRVDAGPAEAAAAVPLLFVVFFLLFAVV